MLLVTYKELVGIWWDMRNDVFRSAVFQASSVDELMWVTTKSLIDILGALNMVLKASGHESRKFEWMIEWLWQQKPSGYSHQRYWRAAYRLIQKELERIGLAVH